MSSSMHSQFTLLHEDEGNDIIFRFQEVLAEGIVRQFVNFMRACGYHEESIHSVMSQVAEEYYDCKEKQRLGLLNLDEEVA